jgi:hypothetical protein
MVYYRCLTSHRTDVSGYVKIENSDLSYYLEFVISKRVYTVVAAMASLWSYLAILSYFV